MLLMTNSAALVAISLITARKLRTYCFQIKILCSYEILSNIPGQVEIELSKRYQENHHLIFTFPGRVVIS